MGLPLAEGAPDNDVAEVPASTESGLQAVDVKVENKDNLVPPAKQEPLSPSASKETITRAEIAEKFEKWMAMGGPE